MTFIKKSQAEIAKLSDEDAEKYFGEKDANDLLVQEKAIETAVSTAKKDLDAKLKEANDKADQLGIKVVELETKGFGERTIESEVKKFLKENEAKLKTLHSEGQGFIELEIKAVGDITTANGINTSPPAIIGTQLAPISNVNLREIPILGLTTNINTTQAAYAYTEAIPGEGDALAVAEGTAKPQIDFDWETNYAKPVKVAAWERLTEESVQDVAGLESVAKDYLLKRHNLKKAKLILFGTGVAPQPKGATLYGRLFSAGDMALAVDSPNFMDVVNAVVTDVSTTHNYVDETPYRPSLVMINPVDFFIQIASAKDTQGHNLYPQASLFNNLVIGGVTIMSDESIPAGKIFAADMSKYYTTNYISYRVKIGWINDDFIKNQFIILGESRFHAFVKNLDAQAFIYDDIATIKTAITKP
jgi:TolA-binding protein